MATNGTQNGGPNGHAVTQKGKLPEYGRRLMCRIVDETAHDEPSKPFCAVQRSDDFKDGWKHITYGELANAINYEAHDIIKKVGAPAPGSFPTLAYIGPNDIRYIVFTLATQKTGYKALFVSPRNSTAGQINLFEQTDCHTIFLPESHRKMVEPWLQIRDMDVYTVDPLDAMLHAEGVENFPYTKTFEEAEWDPAVVLHTSGSTGLPKPIVARQGMWAGSDARRGHLPQTFLDGKPSFFLAWSQLMPRMLFPMPLFHAAGLAGSLCLSLYYGVICYYFNPGRPINSDLVLEALQYADVDGVMLAPSMVEDFAKSDEGMAAMKKLNAIGFAGGNLAKEVGDRLVNNGIFIFNAISSTEYFPYCLHFQSDPKLWNYFVFNSEIMGADWRRAPGEEDVYELVIKRKDPKKPAGQGVFYTFPELSEWSTKDLYKPHPTEPHCWTFYGRVDNVIVFSNGEKLNPVTIEETVMGHPAVRGALVVGAGRFEPLLIVEPKTYPKTPEEAQKLIDEVWPTVRKVNEDTVAHGRIDRKFIMLTREDKPLPRSGKGVIQRAEAGRMYRREIDAFYADIMASDDARAARMDTSSPEALTECLRELFHTHLGAPPLGPDADFFSTAGVDSLQVINATRLIRSGLKAAGSPLPGAAALVPRHIYQNPTPAKLAAYLLATLRRGSADANRRRNSTSGNPEPNARDIQVMRDMLAKYTADLPAKRPGKQPPRDDGMVVLVTGTTGSLGAYLLDALVSCPRVRKVVALNRDADGGRGRQPAVSAARGLFSKFNRGDGNKAEVEFLQLDTAKPFLGLGEETHGRLLREADRVVHNAWPVNFNMGVASFEPSVAGVRALVDFAAAAERRVPVVFVSSISVVEGWPAEEDPVPEAQLTDLSLPRMGYGQSKLLASLVLDAACERSGVPAASIRVGQVAGPRGDRGVWNRQEFIPSLIASSVYLGMLPETLGTMASIDWIPVEDVAAAILEVAGVLTAPLPVDELPGYYHGVNPVNVSWAGLAAAIKDFYGDRITRIVPFEEWVDALERSASQHDDIEKNPGVKLLDTYRGMAHGETGLGCCGWEMAKTKARCPTIRNLEGITPELMTHWCEQWKY